MVIKDIYSKEVIYKSTIEKIVHVLRPELSFYIASLIYGAGVSILTLAIPISVQSLVNTVNFGSLAQPLLVLSFILLSLLIFSGVLRAAQKYIIELFQRRFYVRASSDITKNLLHASAKSFRSVNGTDLTNRYFDIMTIQKKMAVLLMDTIALVLQTIVGLILLGFYHPYFLVFDIVLVLSIWSVWLVYGRKAVLTALDESKAKYQVANWMQQISQNNLFFKSYKRRNEAAQKSHDLVENYIEKRKKHFAFLFRQTLFLLFIYAVMSAMVLGLGGYLALKGQLTIGQLVAAELVVTVILASIAKSGKHLEAFYDIAAAIDKVFAFYEIEKDEPVYSDLKYPKSFDLHFDKVNFTTSKYKFEFDYNFKESKNYHVNSYYNSSKICFIDLLYGIEESKLGLINIGGLSIKQIGPLYLRDIIYIVSKPNVFNGSIEENLKVGHKDLTPQEINEVLELVDLDYLEHVYEDGLNTNVLPNGFPFWASQLIRLEIAKAILAKPKIIVLTELIEQLEPKRQKKILNYLAQSDMTVILFSKDKYEGFDFEKITFEKGSLNVRGEDELS